MDDNRKDQDQTVELEEATLDQVSGGQVVKPVIKPVKEVDPEGGGEFHAV